MFMQSGLVVLWSIILRHSHTRPRRDGNGIGRGGGEEDGDQRRGKQTPGRPGPAEQWSAEKSRKDSPVRRESKGTRSVVRIKGDGGRGAERGERGTARIKREVERRSCCRQAPVATQVLPA